jgi:phosphatidylglycerophosphate synthase
VTTAGPDCSVSGESRPRSLPGAGVRVLVVGPGRERLLRQIPALAARGQIVVETADAVSLSPCFDAAAEAGDAVAVVAGDVVVPDEGLLRIVDDPALECGALVTRGPGHHPVATDGSIVLAAATARHPVHGADADSVGVVYVAAPLVPAAADALESVDTAWVGLDPLDLVLAVLVRAPLLPPVTAVPLEPLPGARVDDEAAAERLAGEVAEVDATSLATHSAARAGDGFYSTFVLRRLAAHVTPWAVRHGISATAMTLLSALLGVAGAVSFAFGTYPSLALGAVLLQSSIVLDCVDGEIARATRTRSAFGGWLDAATDRIKEYGALAGLALAAGPHFWWVATAGMVVQTARHVRDFAFSKGVLAAYRRTLARDRRPLSDTAPWIRPAGITAGESGLASMWLRRIVQLPIGERWLVLCLAALLNAPGAGLIGYLVLTALSSAVTLAGAARRSTAALSASVRQLQPVLADYRDAGILLPLNLWRGSSRALGWLLPSGATFTEGAVVVLVTQAVAGDWAAAAFAWFAVVAWHRYDVIYRRGGGMPAQPRAVSVLGGGWPARVVAIVVGAATGALPVVLVAGTVWMALVYVPESLATGLRTRRLEVRP